tara:strand:+ start:1505 stop:1753 length:249 start_codon:yes stop_codon:yes gene_type:complete
MKEERYFDDLTLEEMFESHDWTYMYSDDNRWYESGRRQKEIINNKIEELGGWSQDILKLHNKYCPKPMQLSEEWMENYLLKQ